MKNRICGGLMLLAGGCLTLAGCEVTGGFTAGGTDTSGFTIGATVDSDAKRAAYAAWVFDKCMDVAVEGRVEAKVCLDYLAEYAKSHNGGPMVTAFQACMDGNGRFDECIEFAKLLQKSTASDP